VPRAWLLFSAPTLLRQNGRHTIQAQPGTTAEQAQAVCRCTALQSPLVS
jgi:hypothetical protein